MPQQPQTVTTAEAFAALTVPQLKQIAWLVTESPPGRKGELVDLLVRTMRDGGQLRRLHDSLDATGKAAIREAVYADGGVLDTARFVAKYGKQPDLGGLSDYYGGWSSYGEKPKPPTVLRLFFPAQMTLAADLIPLLKPFVSKPPPVQLAALDELPETDVPDAESEAAAPDEEDETVQPLRVQPTERAALHDVHAVLRLIDSGKIGVSATTRRPGQAAVQAVAAVLHSGDFYGPDEEGDPYEWASDDRNGLYFKSFAWLLIVQVAGFAELAGSRLQLTPAGRKAAAQPAQAAIRAAWRKWAANATFDEFNRVSEIKGQSGGGKRHLTAVAPRRRVVVEALAGCPAGKWIDVDELFRYMIATGQRFEVTREPWSLYIVDSHYGSLGYEGHNDWDILQGRYILALLFEYAATMGLVDIAYVSPIGARADFRGLWGADDLAYLSRYDGLRFFRITPLGAWCLGQAARYEPAPLAIEPDLKVLPNLDVVVTRRSLAPGDALLLGRFAEQTADSVWRLSPARCIDAVEDGLSLAELGEFLTSHSGAELPQTASVFLRDLEERATQLRDLGAARLVECHDAALAHLIARDRQLREVCLIAGERNVVFRAADEPLVRRRLHDLGYALPPAK